MPRFRPWHLCPEKSLRLEPCFNRKKLIFTRVRQYKPSIFSPIFLPACYLPKDPLPGTAFSFRLYASQTRYGISRSNRRRRCHSGFPGTSCSSMLAKPTSHSHVQGRAGLVALRRYRGATNALGRPFYKGGFEPRMNRREAALILELSYVTSKSCLRKFLPYAQNYRGCP